MGKRKTSTKYEHVHTYNPRAHESDDRRIERLQAMEMKRYQAVMDKQKAAMKCYLPPDARIAPKIGACSFIYILEKAKN